MPDLAVKMDAIIPDLPGNFFSFTQTARDLGEIQHSWGSISAVHRHWDTELGQLSVGILHPVVVVVVMMMREVIAQCNTKYL